MSEKTIVPNHNNGLVVISPYRDPFNKGIVKEWWIEEISIVARIITDDWDCDPDQDGSNECKIGLPVCCDGRPDPYAVLNKKTGHAWIPNQSNGPRDDHVRGIHKLRTRKSGQVDFVQLHLEMDGEIALAQAHTIADRIEKEMRSMFPGSDVIIHEDPYYPTRTL